MLWAVNGLPVSLRVARSHTRTVLSPPETTTCRPLSSVTASTDQDGSVRTVNGLPTGMPRGMVLGERSGVGAEVAEGPVGDGPEIPGSSGCHSQKAPATRGRTVTAAPAARRRRRAGRRGSRDAEGVAGELGARDTEGSTGGLGTRDAGEVAGELGARDSGGSAGGLGR
ncbi:hypothetical protein Aros01_07995 [Streptosporangium roseum]